MIPYEIDKIQTMADVAKEFPKMFDINNLKNIYVKRFIKEEIKKYDEEVKAQAEYDKVIGLKPVTSHIEARIQFIALAEVRALYRYYWCHYNVLDQISKYGYRGEDVYPIMLRMVHTRDFDPWSTTEPTAGQFLESLQNYGYKKVVAKDGYEFYVRNSAGYSAKRSSSAGLDDTETNESDYCY